MSGKEALYTETCNALRHYSICIMNMRTLVVAQGLALLSAAGYTSKFDNPLFFYLVIGFGILFTLTLQSQQKNYLGDFEIHLGIVAELEEELGNGTKGGSWKKYKEERHEHLRKKKSPFRLLIESGPYNLFLVCFAFLLFLKIVGWLKGFEISG